MKRILQGMTLVIGMMISSFANSQTSVQVNISSQPDWGPRGHQFVTYYYLPGLDIYYSVEHRKYVYLDGGQWIWTSSLPSKYAHYNLYTGYKVVLTGGNPFSYHHEHQFKYRKYKNCYGLQKANKQYHARSNPPANSKSKGNYTSHSKQLHSSPNQKSKGHGLKVKDGGRKK